MADLLGEVPFTLRFERAEGPPLPKFASLFAGPISNSDRRYVCLNLVLSSALKLAGRALSLDTDSFISKTQPRLHPHKCRVLIASVLAGCYFYATTRPICLSCRAISRSRDLPVYTRQCHICLECVLGKKKKALVIRCCAPGVNWNI